MWSPAERRLQELLSNMMLGDMSATMFDSPFGSAHFSSAFFGDPVSAMPPVFPANYNRSNNDDDEEQLRKAIAASVTDRGAETDSDELVRALAESSKQYSAQRSGEDGSSDDDQWIVDAADLQRQHDPSTPSEQPALAPPSIESVDDEDDDALLQHAIALSQENAKSPAPSVAATAWRSFDEDCVEQALQLARDNVRRASPLPTLDPKEVQRRQTVLEQNAEMQRAIDADRARLEMERAIERAKLERQNQLAAVVETQLPAEPAPQPGKTCTIAVRLPNSSRIERTWSLDTPLLSVATWTAAALIASGKPVLPSEFHLVTGFPNARKLLDTSSTLDELGIGGRVLLTVDLCAD